MGYMDKFDKFNRLLSRVFEWLGLGAFLVMMLITCIDVIGSKIFLRPVPGSIDIVMLSQLVAISFTAASALIFGRHIHVDFFVTILPRHAQVAISCIMHFFVLVFFGLVVWRLCAYGYSLQIGKEISPTAHIPLYPFAYGIALASIPVCLVSLSDLLKSIFRLTKR